MTTKLNQVIAIEKGVKSRTYAEVNVLDKALQKPELFNGFSKKYQKLDDEGEDLPPESKRVQQTVPDTLKVVERAHRELFEITAKKDWTNCLARGDVVINGQTLLTGVPVSYLLFLEKQLTDLRTLFGRMPVLDISEDWTKDPNSDLYKTAEIRTHRTKKVQRPIVLYAATPEHPAQTQMITEDVLAGHWVLTRQSGALPAPDRQLMLERVEQLLQAVKFARENANMTDVVQVPDVGAALFGYIRGE